MDDVASAAVSYLSGQPKILAQVGAVASTDPVAANAGHPYIFKNDLLVTLEGTSAAAIVLTPAGSMSGPPVLGSARFQRLSVAVYLDPSRDSGRNITETSGLTILRGEALFSELHALLHSIDSAVQQWGDMLVLSSALLSEGQFLPVPDGDGMQRKESFYSVTVWGWTDITVP